MAAVNRTLLVIGYGSLLSGYGLLSERRNGASRLIALDAFPVRLHNARRGLAKPTGHGRYLAMDLEPIDPAAPIVASAAPVHDRYAADGANADGNVATTLTANGSGQPSNHDASGSGIGALGLVFDRDSAPLIARREEYDDAKLNELLDLADHAATPIGDFLLAIAQRTGFNLLAYRSALRELLGYTSPGYIFHPLPLADGRAAIVAIASGFDGSGDPAVQSKRSRFGMNRLLTLSEALAHPTFDMDPHGQVGYYVECILGGYHGIDVSDLVTALDNQPGNENGVLDQHGLAGRLAAVTKGERERFQRATSLDEAHYMSAFGSQPHPALGALLSSSGA
ncbi:MAG: hypothetical protein ACRETL_10910 [Gammaproteobacteria bacterium]